ncbi:hypothetical protein GPECTOR_13g732 [Gonium pectorale]|uniref:Uncharacterized protein n=1 Tax=Gonium pectorale TaxID=33097 RepID=A0A150GN93_GONPE|nr:hypothetical protein GPECTOR_13g732 [Gonium pectorale]|eukprot:KXZ51245.1 hypothetical protein GPECTOR_13g732 [Gonium pectorale]
MNDKQAKKLMGEAGLPITGGKQDWEKRYARYRTYLQAERDKGTQASAKRLLQAFLSRELALDAGRKQPATAPSWALSHIMSFQEQLKAARRTPTPAPGAAAEGGEQGEAGAAAEGGPAELDERAEPAGTAEAGGQGAAGQQAAVAARDAAGGGGRGRLQEHGPGADLEATTAQAEAAPGSAAAPPSGPWPSLLSCLPHGQPPQGRPRPGSDVITIDDSDDDPDAAPLGTQWQEGAPGAATPPSGQRRPGGSSSRQPVVQGRSPDRSLHASTSPGNGQQHPGEPGNGLRGAAALGGGPPADAALGAWQLQQRQEPGSARRRGGGQKSGVGAPGLEAAAPYGGDEDGGISSVGDGCGGGGGGFTGSKGGGWGGAPEPRAPSAAKRAPRDGDNDHRVVDTEPVGEAPAPAVGEGDGRADKASGPGGTGGEGAGPGAFTPLQVELPLQGAPWAWQLCSGAAVSGGNGVDGTAVGDGSDAAVGCFGGLDVSQLVQAGSVASALGAAATAAAGSERLADISNIPAGHGYGHFNGYSTGPAGHGTGGGKGWQVSHQLAGAAGLGEPLQEQVWWQ